MTYDAELEARLVRYCAIDTQSDETSASEPSTAIQLDLARLLRDELAEIGAADVRLTDYGAVLATIPGNVAGAPTIGWLAHVDTAPQFNATGVKPLVRRAWDGSDILFPDAPELRLSPADSPYLAGKIGDDIVTASGATLLGADDKAGIAIVMTAARALLAGDAPHGDIRIAFTPDEEIGRGVHSNLPRDLAAPVAYTFDGGPKGKLSYESFSADKAVVTVEGVSIHPGWAKGKLVNALHLAAKIVDTLPQVTRTPETTEEREGFIHVYEVKGSAASAEIRLILRDFELDGLAAHGALVRKVAEAVAAGEPRAKISVEITPQYRNMRYWLEKDMRPVEIAREAYLRSGVEPESDPIRGGTDGSRLTEMGVPTPNLFAGMQNVHSPLEWVSVQDMAAAVDMAIELARLWSEQRG